MPQAFLETAEDRLLIARLDLDHAIGNEPGARAGARFCHFHARAVCALQKNCPAEERSGDASGNYNPMATAGELRTSRERWFHGSSQPMSVAYLEKLNPAQRRAVEHGVRENDAAPGTPLLVIAGAGSGKTNTLAHRVAHLIVNGADPRKILLILTTGRRRDGAACRADRA
jgi:hypothetical protein